MEEESRARREVVSWDVMRVVRVRCWKEVNHWREAGGGVVGNLVGVEVDGGFSVVGDGGRDG